MVYMEATTTHTNPHDAMFDAVEDEVWGMTELVPEWDAEAIVAELHEIDNIVDLARFVRFYDLTATIVDAS